MTRYLRHISIGRFGKFADRSVGPFGPGLNVVYGPNEAGKSTLSAMVSGVLFGWEEAHGVRNTYRPGEGGRSGTLEWADTASDPSSADEGSMLHRDEAGLSGDASFTADVDRETFDAVFSFSADDLRSLGDSSDVTARLLAAASGTGSSPVSAFAEVERRISGETQRILQLGEQVESVRNRVRQLTDQAELCKQEDRELRELTASRSSVSERLDETNGAIGDILAWRAEIEAADTRASELRDTLDSLMAEQRETSSAPWADEVLDARLIELDSAGERVLRDRIDEFSEAREKADRMLDTAKENSATSTAAYEALVELGDDDTKEKASSRLASHHVAQVVLSALLPVVFITAGVPLFMHGRRIASLSFTVLGLALVLCAVFLAVAAVAVFVRPARGEAAVEGRRKDAQWVMLQDRKKLDACAAEKTRIDNEITEFFDRVGLGTAGGSLRQARSLLDEAHERRSANAAAEQRVFSLDLRIRDVRDQLAAIERTRVRIGVAAGIDNATVRDLDALARKRTAERDALLESAGDMSRRMGELANDLDRAKRDTSFYAAKQEYHGICTRLREAKHALIELLLAKRMLERGIAAWESQSQPAVYDRAGALLSLITGGTWTRVSISSTGSLVAVDSRGTVCDPRHLSLGTRQQLYLALRIALLQTMSGVGRSVPVLADDILVNFDAERRVGAARALAELARDRQVIVFTCHSETADLLMGATRIDL